MDGALRDAVVEVEAHVAREGWDQPIRLFAIVPTDTVRAGNPELSLLAERDYASLEQDTQGRDVEALLGGIEWDADVVGAVLVLERLLRDDVSAASSDVRIACGVLRDGTAACALRHRSHDSDDSVGTGSDLAPALRDALVASFG